MSVIEKAVQRAGELWCGLFGGHYYVEEFGVREMHLACIYCGRTSKGWIVG